MTTLKEKLAEAKRELAEVKAAVEGGEKGAEELNAAIEGVKAAQANLEAAEEASAWLKSIGSGSRESGEGDGEPAAKSLGEHFANFIKGVHVERGKKIALSAPVYREKADPAVHVTPTGAGTYADVLRTVDPTIREGIRPRLVMAGLFSQAQVTAGNSVTYFRESAEIEGGFAGVAENGKKPQISFGEPVEVSETLKKVAGYYKVSDEVLDDAPRLADHINGRALYKHDDAVDDALLNGDGTGANMRGLLNTSGIQAMTYPKDAELSFDVLLDAIAAVEDATNFEADAIVMNPSDYNELMKTKDSNGQYFTGGPFLGQYGNGTVTKKPPIWGVPVVTTAKMARGTVLVGAFKQGGTVYSKNGTQVSVYNQNEDDAIHNRITIVVESREVLAVEYPHAFVKVTQATN